MNALQKPLPTSELSTRLDGAIATLVASQQIAPSTKAFLHNQAIVYAAYLDGVMSGTKLAKAETHAEIHEVIESFCDLICTELEQPTESTNGHQ